MTYAEDKHRQAKSDMLGEFNKAILDAEDRRKVEPAVSDRTYRLAAPPTSFITSRFATSCAICPAC